MLDLKTFDGKEVIMTTVFSIDYSIIIKTKSTETEPRYNEVMGEGLINWDARKAYKIAWKSSYVESVDFIKAGHSVVLWWVLFFYGLSHKNSAPHRTCVRPQTILLALVKGQERHSDKRISYTRGPFCTFLLLYAGVKLICHARVKYAEQRGPVWNVS